ncbi:MAG: hypothetical protein ACOYS2_02385 [Patescibacteria group bacterium]
MYWIFFAFFILGVLIPDLVRVDWGPLSEERLEEIAIFCLGASGFFIFIIKEKQLFSEKEKRREREARLDKTGKDLLQSYSYIGEVNRKMDILMGLALGLYKTHKMDPKEEKDSYFSIANASKLLLKGKDCNLLILDVKKKEILKTIFLGKKQTAWKAKDISSLGGDINIKKDRGFLITASPNKINNIRSYLIIEGYSPEEEMKPKNLEILKVLASQALFLYSFAVKSSSTKEVPRS